MFELDEEDAHISSCGISNAEIDGTVGALMDSIVFLAVRKAMSPKRLQNLTNEICARLDAEPAHVADRVRSALADYVVGAEQFVKSNPIYKSTPEPKNALSFALQQTAQHVDHESIKSGS